MNEGKYRPIDECDFSGSGLRIVRADEKESRMGGPFWEGRAGDTGRKPLKEADLSGSGLQIVRVAE